MVKGKIYGIKNKIKTYQMIDQLSKEKCCGCEACLQVCPKSCISLEMDNEGFWYPIIDKSICVNCNKCDSVCPGIKELNVSPILKSYAAINKNENTRFSSSSGGVFFELANLILSDENGVVYGAAFDSLNEVKHIRIDKITDIYRLQKSKYLQSRINTTFIEILNDLKSSKNILFVGTPCQIKALSLFLSNKNKENLITVDIACHGVPSLKIWNTYLDSIKADKKNIKVDFRDKQAPWHNYTISILKKNSDRLVFERSDKNPFMKGFVYNLYNRPSCHNCPAKNFSSGSDLMLADYWGIEKFYPDFDDDKGTSLVITKTLKGEILFNRIKKNFKFIETDLETVLCRKDTFLQSTKPHYRRNEFISKVNSQNFAKMVNKYLLHSYPFSKRILRLIKRVF